MTAEPVIDAAFLARTLSVGQIAEASGVSPSAVRFYESNGLITSIRTSGNQRRFLPVSSCRIRVARVAQRVGLTVREIADILDSLPEEPTVDDWDTLNDVLIEQAHRRIRQLRATLDDLASDSKLCEID